MEFKRNEQNLANSELLFKGRYKNDVNGGGEVRVAGIANKEIA